MAKRTRAKVHANERRALTAVNTTLCLQNEALQCRNDALRRRLDNLEYELILAGSTVTSLCLQLITLMAKLDKLHEEAKIPAGIDNTAAYIPYMEGVCVHLFWNETFLWCRASSEQIEISP